MKRIFTLLIITIAAAQAQGQAILNEVYAFPGGSRNEFFEFYNNSTSSHSMDNYTIVTYFEEGSKKGFYVLDLPNMNVPGLGYFVGSSAIPFNYQGVTNSSNSNYSWNNLAFLAANNAYLRKWEMSTNVPAAIDGNAGYDLAPVPAGFNDIFQKIGGGSASYNVFVYRNGVLLSIFLGGTGGNTFIPTYIVGLPTLNIDMSGSAPDFTINFSGYATARTEYVIQDIGSDNGYIRLNDGLCGSWTKSSSQVNHTPGVANGGGGTYANLVSVSAMVVHGNATSGSTVNFDVVAGPAEEFPITLKLYADNGTVPGQLDINDTYLTSQVETVVTEGPWSYTFFPYNSNILIQTITSAGCIDALRFIPNTSVLPVRFTGFNAKTIDNKVALNWSVAENESGKKFEVEKSVDGRNYHTIALVFATMGKGTEAYEFHDKKPEVKAWYRIKSIDNANRVIYTNTIAVANLDENTRTLSLQQNPVESYLVFQYQSPENAVASINIYNASGALMHTQKTNLTKDSNSIAINMDGRISAGLYVLEVRTQHDQKSVKFIKR